MSSDSTARRAPGVALACPWTSCYVLLMSNFGSSVAPQGTPPSPSQFPESAGFYRDLYGNAVARERALLNLNASLTSMADIADPSGLRRLLTEGVGQIEAVRLELDRVEPDPARHGDFLVGVILARCDLVIERSRTEAIRSAVEQLRASPRTLEARSRILEHSLYRPGINLTALVPVAGVTKTAVSGHCEFLASLGLLRLERTPTRRTVLSTVTWLGETVLAEVRRGGRGAALRAVLDREAPPPALEATHESMRAAGSEHALQGTSRPHLSLVGRFADVLQNYERRKSQ